MKKRKSMKYIMRRVIALTLLFAIMATYLPQGAKASEIRIQMTKEEVNQAVEDMAASGDRTAMEDKNSDIRMNTSEVWINSFGDEESKQVQLYLQDSNGNKITEGVSWYMEVVYPGGFYTDTETMGNSELTFSLSNTGFVVCEKEVDSGNDGVYVWAQYNGHLYYSLVLARSVKDSKTVIYTKKADQIIEENRWNELSTDVEKVLAVHDYLIETITYDRSYIFGDFKYGALVEGKAVCYGYAQAFQFLVNKMGITCEVQKGYHGDIYHAWNIVELDDGWYYVDVTQDDVDHTEGRYRHFLINRETLEETHTPDDKSVRLMGKKYLFYPYTREGQYAKNESELEKSLIRQLNATNDTTADIQVVIPQSLRYHTKAKLELLVPGSAIQLASMTDNWPMGGDYIIQKYRVSNITTRPENLPEDLDNEETICSDQLPVCYINTAGDVPITSKENYVSADMKIQMTQEDGSKTIVFEGSTQIKGRGNSTWYAPKKPYRIKLDSKADLFGMGISKDWVLLANYVDESMMRNTLAAQYAKILDVEAMDSVWVQVILNGEYQGTYQLCEQIQIDEERVDIFDWEEEAKRIAKAIYENECSNGMTQEQADDLAAKMKEDMSWVTTGVIEGYQILNYTSYEQRELGGYLFELDERLDEETVFRTEDGLGVMVKSPEFLLSNDERLQLVMDFWNRLESAWKSVDGYTTKNTANNSQSQHYTELMDVDSMTAFWLVNELLKNIDANTGSRYAYLDFDEKLVFGPIWDFDNSSGNRFTDTDFTGWMTTKEEQENEASPVYSNFFKELTDDPYFCMLLMEKYWEHRDEFAAYAEVNGWIDQNMQYLLEAALENQEYLKDIAAKEDYENPCPKGFKQDVEDLKSFIKNRLAWMDEQFSSLEKAIDSLSNQQSAIPYQKAEQLQMNLENADLTKESTNSPLTSNWTVYEGETIILKLTDMDSTLPMSQVQCYINGIKYESEITFDKDTAQIMIPVAAIGTTAEKISMISVVATNVTGDKCWRNYTTVTVEPKRNTTVTPEVPSEKPEVPSEKPEVPSETPVTPPIVAPVIPPSETPVTPPIVAPVFPSISTPALPSVDISSPLPVPEVQKYQVVYMPNGGNGSKKTQTVENKKSIKLEEMFTAPKGYTFKGWNTSADGSGTNYSKGTSFQVTENTTLYAIWKKEIYQIKYNLNGGTVSKSNPKQYSVTSNNITLSKPSRSGYTFLGWYTDSSFKKKAESIAIKKGSTGNKTFYAKWAVKTVSSLKQSGAGINTIQLSWKKTSGIDGYEIYRATSYKGKYQKVKTIDKATKVSYTNKNNKNDVTVGGKKYYYKIRAYKIVNGKKQYSSFSSPVKAVATAKKK